MVEVRTGVLLLQVGTPDAPTPRAVRRYLREFLGDPRVLDLPAPARALLLHGAILPFRPRRSAEAYRKIWTDAGSPLLLHSRALRRALAGALGPEYVVELAMRYGRPSLDAALTRLAGADLARVLVLPLFPQHAEATTGSALAQLEQELARRVDLPPSEALPSFYADGGFSAAWAAVARPVLDAFAPDFVLLSYHGLPQRQVRAGDPGGAHCLERSDCCDALGIDNRRCYRAQCFATTRALTAALGLRPEASATAFQSKLGRAAWIGPASDALLEQCAAAGRRRLAVLCPSFVADCLETLEEIGIRARERWLALGGEELLLVPSLNAHPAWVDCIAGWIRRGA